MWQVKYNYNGTPKQLLEQVDVSNLGSKNIGEVLAFFRTKAETFKKNAMDGDKPRIPEVNKKLEEIVMILMQNQSFWSKVKYVWEIIFKKNMSDFLDWIKSKF
jgi:hypothetical protein